MRNEWLSRGEWLVVVLTPTIGGLLLFLLSGLTVHWVGHTDLEIEFVVMDAATEIPISGATIMVHSEGGFWAEREPQDFTLVTDNTGSAKRLCQECMCFGTSGWGIDSFAVHLPEWYYRGKAETFATTPLTELNNFENVNQVKRGKPFARLLVRIPLKKEVAN